MQLELSSELVAWPASTQTLFKLNTTCVLATKESANEMRMRKPANAIC